jgi:hypothetical protein
LFWQIWEATGDYVRYLRHRAKGVRVEVTCQHDQYYIEVKGGRVEKYMESERASLVSSGASFTEVFTSVARLLKAMERHTGEQL